MDLDDVFTRDELAADCDTWEEILIFWADWSHAETIAARQLYPVLTSIEQDRHLDQWFFVRKYPCWRLRYAGDNTAREYLLQSLNDLIAVGEVRRMARSIYEPETLAFGGAQAMVTAHRLFHDDSNNILLYFANRHVADTPNMPGRRELALLLISVLLRGAELDWYEQGDVWYRIACLRKRGSHPASKQQREQTQRLMTADVLLATTEGPMQPLHDWIRAFQDAGEKLAEHAERERLSRGLRAVLAHHAIFAWNRLGIAAQDQEVLANRATAVVMADDGPDSIWPVTEAGAGPHCE